MWDQGSNQGRVLNPVLFLCQRIKILKNVIKQKTKHRFAKNVQDSFIVCCFLPYLTVFRAYSWLCIQKSFPTGLGKHRGFQDQTQVECMKGMGPIILLAPQTNLFLFSGFFVCFDSHFSQLRVYTLRSVSGFSPGRLTEPFTVLGSYLHWSMKYKHPAFWTNSPITLILFYIFIITIIIILLFFEG